MAWRLSNSAEGSGQVPFLLAEQRRGWSLMIFCARATRGLRKVGGNSQTILLARRTRTMKLVLVRCAQ